MRLGVVLVLVLAAASFASVSGTPTDTDFQAAADQLDSFIRAWMDEGNIDKAMEYFHEDAFSPENDWPRIMGYGEQFGDPGETNVRNEAVAFLEWFRSWARSGGGPVWQHPSRCELDGPLGEEEVGVHSAYNAAFFVPSETFLDDLPPYLVAKISEGDASLFAVVVMRFRDTPDEIQAVFYMLLRRQKGTWKIIYLDTATM